MTSISDTSPQGREVRLIQQASRGDENAFTALFKQQFQAVYNFTLWLSNDPTLAEDLTQEVFIRFHKNLSRFGPPWKLRAWLFQSARNLFFDLGRREKIVKPLDPDSPLAASTFDLEREVISDEVAAQVWNAIQGLPSLHREALILREIDGFDYGDIAMVMDVSVDYVGVLLHRARAKFKENYSLRILAEDPLQPCQVLFEKLDNFHDGIYLEDQEQERLVREHVKECSACQQRQRELTAIAILFTLLPPIAPPARLERRILRRTAGQKRMRKIRVGAAAVGVLAVLVVVWLLPNGSFKNVPPPTEPGTANRLIDPTPSLPGTLFSNPPPPTSFPGSVIDPTETVSPTLVPPTETPTLTLAANTPIPPTATSTSLPPTPTPAANSGITGIVWSDEDYQGDLDGGEPRWGNVTVELRVGGCNAGVSQSLKTNGSGQYSFSGLQAGTYCVRVDITSLPPGNWAASAPSFPIGQSPTREVTIGASELVSGANFGFQTVIE